MQIIKDFCFLTKAEANSWNRVKGAPGTRMPDKTDHARVSFILEHCDNHGITKMRSEDGVKLHGSEA